MTDDASPPTPRVLRAKPFDIHLAVLRLVSNGEDGLPIYEQADEIETVGIVFDANALCDVEDEFGSMAAWQELLDQRPYNTCRDTIAAVLGRDKRLVGLQMIAEQYRFYLAALGAAFSVANGVDPTKAWELTAWIRADPNDDPKTPPEPLVGANANATSDTPGRTGSQGGSPPAATTKRSGG